MRNLVIGLGEVGKALQEVLDCEGYDITDEHPYRVHGAAFQFEVIHVAFPWSEEFVEAVQEYQRLLNPDLTIIYSTVPIGTSESLGAVHSPVEGHHPDVTGSINIGIRWLGSTDEHLLDLAQEVWEEVIAIGLHIADSADFTEFLKLRSTSRYGINIAFADYEADVASKLGMPYDLLMEYDRDYNYLYRFLTKGGSDVGRYVLTDPQGKIGGHCVVPNAKILYEQYPHNMLLDIIDMDTGHGNASEAAEHSSQGPE